MHAKSLQLCPTLCDPMDGAHQAPLSRGFSRQKNWSGVQCPPPCDLPDPGIEPVSLTPPMLSGMFFTTRADKMTQFDNTVIEKNCTKHSKNVNKQQLIYIAGGSVNLYDNCGKQVGIIL